MKLRWLSPSLLCGILIATPARHAGASITNSLIAWFQFESNCADTLRRCPDIDLKEADYIQGALYLNGGYEFCADSPSFRAVASIPGLNYESCTMTLDFFPVDFDDPTGKGASLLRSWIQTLTLGRFGHFNETSHETILMAGTSCRWLGFRQRNGQLELTLNNQDFVHTFTNVAIHPRQWHTLACSADFKRREILTFLDGRKLDVVGLPEDFKLRILGSKEEDSDREISFSNYSNGTAFHGYADDLCVFDRALSEDEIIPFLRSRPQRAVPFPSAENILENRIVWLMFPLVLLASWTLHRRRITSKRA